MTIEFKASLPTARLLGLTSMAMIAFAGNSLLCRMALKAGHIDPASFTSLRILSGAIALWILFQRNRPPGQNQGNWFSAMALFVYAAGFSYAYINLPAGTGALLLFGAVQVTMIAYAVWSGERLASVQLLGFVLATLGLVYLLLPGISSPPMDSALLMLCAGMAWGVYSLRGRGAGNPNGVTSGNFLRAVPFAIALTVLMVREMSIGAAGVALAVASGVLTSALGYAVWYTVLPELKATTAATVQLSVPVIAAIGGVLLLGEAVSVRLAVSSAAVLGGIALVIWRRPISNTNE